LLYHRLLFPGPVFGLFTVSGRLKPGLEMSRRRPARTMIRHRVRFKKLHIPLHIGNAIISPNSTLEIAAAETKATNSRSGGCNEGYSYLEPQGFRGNA
jgi:hypothetical protein